SATNRTYQDLLETAYDDACFTWYGTTQLTEVSCDGEVLRKLRAPDLWAHVSVSPDGQYLLTSALEAQFSRIVPHFYFARRLELRDRNGHVVNLLAHQPIAEEVPIQGVRTG